MPKAQKSQRPMPDLTPAIKRGHIWLLYELGQNPTEIHQNLQRAYTSDCPSYQTVCYWYNAFKAGHLSFEEGRRTRRHSNETCERKSDIIERLVQKNPTVALEVIARKAKTTEEDALDILHNELHYHWGPVDSPTQSPSLEARDARKHFCQRFLDRFLTPDSSLSYNIVTCGKTWTYVNSSPTGISRTVWVPKNYNKLDPPPALSEGPPPLAQRVLLTVFFSRTGIVHTVFNTENTGFSSSYYIENCVEPMVKEWHKTHPKTPTSRIILHQGNLRANTSSYSKDRMDKLGIEVLQAPSQSPDLSPCDFWLFPLFKKEMQGRVFKNLDEILEVYKKVLDSLQPSDFHECFDEWFRRVRTVLHYDGDKYVE